MGQQADGSATCDRCGIYLPGYGSVYGLICTDLESAVTRSFIFCYRNNCRTTMLAGMINYPTDGTRCSHCNLSLPVRSVADAMLGSDIQPGGGDETRPLTFCYANESRDAFLSRI